MNFIVAVVIFIIVVVANRYKKQLLELLFSGKMNSYFLRFGNFSLI